MDQENKKAYHITLIGLVANLFLVALKLLAGMYGQSGAIIADAFHSLTDLSTDIAVLIGRTSCFLLRIISNSCINSRPN